MPSRYQRGSVRLVGKVWYGTYREDVTTAEGFNRRQRQVRLGMRAELPTKSAARAKLAEIMGESELHPPTAISFKELVDRWEAAEGPTLKPSTFKTYKRVLRARVLPTFTAYNITDINREAIQKFLAGKAVKYSKSTLRSMRCVLSLTLQWAKDCRWVPDNPCDGIRLPRVTGGKTVTRTVLTPEQVRDIESRLKEPYATLVVFLAASGLRISEAVAAKRSDFTGNVLHITRRVWEGETDDVKSKKSARHLPLDQKLVERMLALKTREWVFESRNGTPVNPGNALKRFIRPAVEKLGINLGGWHDTRHTLNTSLRRNGVDAEVRAGILGHSRASLAMDVYDHPDVSDFEQPLAQVAGQLLQSVTKNGVAA